MRITFFTTIRVWLSIYSQSFKLFDKQSAWLPLQLRLIVFLFGREQHSLGMCDQTDTYAGDCFV